MASTRQLVRPRYIRRVAGVCAALAEYTGLPAWLYRLGFWLTGLVSIWVYLYLWVSLPSEPRPKNRAEADLTMCLKTLQDYAEHPNVRTRPQVSHRLEGILSRASQLTPYLSMPQNTLRVHDRALRDTLTQYLPQVLKAYTTFPPKALTKARGASGLSPEAQFMNDLEVIDQAIQESLGRSVATSEVRASIETLTAEFQKDPNAALQAQFRTLATLAAREIDPEASDLIAKIGQHACAAMPQLLKRSGGNLDTNIYNVRQTAFSYLPDALEQFTSLPVEYRNTYPLNNGKTARENLQEQFILLEATMQKLLGSAFEDDAQGLMAHGEFLRDKFAHTP